MALVGLLGITLGEQAIAMVKQHLTPPLHTSICGVQAPGDVPVGYSNKSGGVFNLLRDDLARKRI
jgi:xanthosine utilization system XapX-like protein